MDVNLLLINQSRLAQQRKKFLDVTKLLHDSVVYNLNIRVADKIFAMPGRNDYIYLLEYRIVGNKADLEAVLPIIDTRITNSRVSDIVIQTYGIDRTNWNIDPRVDKAIEEEISSEPADMDDLVTN